MFDRVQVIGNGRAGQAIAGRLRERGLTVDNHDPALVILCVPDTAIATVAGDVPVGPWIAHVSGATPLSALAPHVNRFSVHPLQSLVLSRGPEQLDGAFAAVTAESADGWSRARWLATTLGLVSFDLSRRESRAVSRGRRDGIQLSGDVVPDGFGAGGGGRSATRGAAAAHAPHHGERIRADRTNRPW